MPDAKDNSQDETKISTEHKAVDDEITVKNLDSQNRSLSKTSEKNDMNSQSGTQEKTKIMFSMSDITDKLHKEIADIPEEYGEDMDHNQMSALIESYFPGRSSKDKIKINRHFLKDVEPFKIEKLIDYAKNLPEGLKTGFQALDRQLSIPPQQITVVAGGSMHGKTIFMLNLMLNMCQLYPEKRFIYYSYDETKWQLITKLINICGSKQFSNLGDFKTNLSQWIHHLKHMPMEELLEKSIADTEFEGLKNYLEVSSRIYIIDTPHSIFDLIDSINSFKSTFNLGAVFIDPFQKIRATKIRMDIKGMDQRVEIIDHLKGLVAKSQFPVIVSSPLAVFSSSAPEYDQLNIDNLGDPFSHEKVGGLIIGLQNYAKSRFIGSNFNNNFKSNFFHQSLEKAEKMPANLIDIMHKTIILAKVLANHGGLEPEEELIFHKQLFKISDIEESIIKRPKA